MYSDKIEELEKSLALAQEDLAAVIEARRSINASLNLVDRLNGLIPKAKLCNDVLQRLHFIGKMGDVASATQAILSKDALTVEEMGTILLFAPQWSKTLLPAGEVHSLKAASLYQVEFIRKSDGAVFYKIGHTGRQLTTRLSGFKYDKRKYSASVHHQILFVKKHVAAAEEARLHLANTALRYEGEPFLTNGHTEVYTEPLISYKLRLEISLYALLGISRD
jgi:hypothetical protein